MSQIQPETTCVDPGLTDILKERITSIFRIEERLVFVPASHGSLSSAPSRNILNMMPDLQGYNAMKVNTCSPFLVPLTTWSMLAQ
jgi:hypothetical protein